MAAEALVPSSAGEAVELFGDGEGVTVFAGGTIVMPEIAAGRLKPERALLLHRTGLDELRTDGDVIRIGPMVTLSALPTTLFGPTLKTAFGPIERCPLIFALPVVAESPMRSPLTFTFALSPP